NRLDDLNRLARRVDTALREVIAHLDVTPYRDVDLHIERAPASELDRPTDAALAGRPPGYAGYLALREEGVIEDLAALLGGLVGIPSSREYLVAVRALLKAWRDAKTGDAAGPDAMTTQRSLWTFDQQYRLRRLAFLERRTDSIFRLDDDGRSLLVKFG